VVEGLLDGVAADDAFLGQGGEGLDDDRLGVDLEEATGGRAGVGEAEAVGAQGVVGLLAPTPRSAAARPSCSR
jgi:hypothetical protein